MSKGLPDRDFYYLIGLRIGNGESAVQHSLWADTAADEGKIWREFLGILENDRWWGGFGEQAGEATTVSAVLRAMQRNQT